MNSRANELIGPGERHVPQPAHPPPDEPRVSVIVCVYNAGDYLRSSIDSVLAQTHRNLEVVVVDDGSTDGCIDDIQHIDDPRLRILRQPNGGKPSALNRGIAAATGEFYAVHDADDLSHRERIARQLRCLQQHPAVAAVFCGYELILGDRHVAPKFGAKDEARCRRDIEALEMPGHDPTAMYRMSMVRGIEYDVALPIVEGYDYVMRVGERFPMRVLGECLYAYRIHWNTVTKRDPSARIRLFDAAVAKTRACRGLPAIESQPAAGGRLRNRQLDNDLVSHFMASMVDLRRAGRRATALRAALRCLQLHPTDPYYYKPAVYALAPLSLISWHRTRRGTA